ncbi:IS5 family transposase [Nitrosospira sp. NRS527]|uniref:IS5 family transposase n=1 Tax=Nitrosospira sp. NRS527 TaxID=155925 RepID=UPI001AFB8E16|nr:IS5 family transposase [Nitrosospira sp. NRS527]BCT69125.1 IS5 family transposase ISNoc2 [Nitrosospira sp. NRS527]
MKPKKQERSGCDDLFRMRLEQMLDQRHALYRLSGKIDWTVVEDHFGALYSEEGRPGIPIRLMVGLHYLKHTFNESDETVVARWVENPYWQHLCGEEYFRHEMPINPSQMTRFRERIGKEGCEFMLGLTVVAGINTKTVSRASVAIVNVDTTVQDKAIAFPTDARLYHKARGALVRLAKQRGIDLRQSYERVSKRALMMNGRYAHARQMRRAKREQKRLRTCLGRVIRDIERKVVLQQTEAGQEHAELKRLLEIAKRIHAQQRHDKGKVYSVHAPEVECIAKGKAHKPYEFGVKVGVVSTSKESFVVGMQALPGNPYDGHTLEASLQQVKRLTGIAPKEVYVDRGYRGHGLAEPVKVWIAGAKRGVTVAIRKKLKRRNAVEPVIGHMKNDGRPGRNFLKGAQGDAMNALLCGAGHNLRKILRRLALLCASFRVSLNQLLASKISNLQLTD